MKHFWPLTIAVVMFAFTAQAGQVNNKPTVSAVQTVQPPPKLPSATPRSSTSPNLFRSAVKGEHFKDAVLH